MAIEPRSKRVGDPVYQPNDLVNLIETVDWSESDLFDFDGTKALLAECHRTLSAMRHLTPEEEPEEEGDPDDILYKIWVQVERQNHTTDRYVNVSESIPVGVTATYKQARQWISENCGGLYDPGEEEIEYDETN